MNTGEALISLSNLEYVGKYDFNSLNIWMSSQKDFVYYETVTSENFDGYFDGYTFIWQKALNGYSQPEYLIIEIRNSYSYRNDELLSIVRDFKLNSLC